MFGYVTADRSAFSEDQLARYRGCYCGLCHQIKNEFGAIHRLALNYDMVFLVLLLNSLYEPQEAQICSRCVVHPVHSHCCWVSEVTSYGASMNVALAYYQSLDDWSDDRSAVSFLKKKLFHGKLEEINMKYPRQCHAIDACIQTLRKVERDDTQEPDVGANLFGTLMGELFVWKEDRWSDQLRVMGNSLGRFIYLMDAVLDLPMDQKRKRYNPFRSRAEIGFSPQDMVPVFQILMGECTEVFERLPLLQDTDLLRNILYSGVWSRYTTVQSSEARRSHNV